MGHNIKVSFDALENLASQLASNAAQLTSSLEAFDRAVAPLKETWTGEAAAAFDIARGQIAAQIAWLNEQLASIAKAIDQIKQAYQSLEKKFVAQF